MNQSTSQGDRAEYSKQTIGDWSLRCPSADQRGRRSCYQRDNWCRRLHHREDWINIPPRWFHRSFPQEPFDEDWWWNVDQQVPAPSPVPRLDSRGESDAELESRLTERISTATRHGREKSNRPNRRILPGAERHWLPGVVRSPAITESIETGNGTVAEHLLVITRRLLVAMRSSCRLAFVDLGLFVVELVACGERTAENEGDHHEEKNNVGISNEKTE